MASLMARLSPVPAFPEYTGPYQVGTIDMEMPVSGLTSPSPAPESAVDVHTMQCRVFYPAAVLSPECSGKRIPWLPAPQRLHVSAYTQFLGVGPLAASVLSFLLRHLHYTSIPVHKNAHLMPPEEVPDKRWPTMIFSHGVGGTRNAYSHMAGSLASHGVVVFCPEHRDGSSVISLVRDSVKQRVIAFRRIAHSQTAEVWAARNDQLRIRLWELGLVLECVLGIDAGNDNMVVSNMNQTTPAAAIRQFAGKLDVLEAGKIIWGGHSFGAASIVQLLKSTYYAGSPQLAAMTKPLFTPSIGSSIHGQITEKTPTVLLDMWCFPLLSAETEALFKLPLPQYADVPSAPGGDGLLVVESADFYQWKENLHVTARVISPEPWERVIKPTAYERPDTGIKLSEPNLFYVHDSAHLNQSDFGILFPWLTKKVFGAQEPERVLRLNLRAQLQFLRSRGLAVSRTWVGDLVEGAHVDKPEVVKGHDDGIHDDEAIFDRSESGRVESWHWVDMMGMGGESSATEREVLSRLPQETDGTGLGIDDGENTGR